MLLHKKWKELLDKLYSEWEFNEIEKYREELLLKFSEWLLLVKKLKDEFDRLSLDTGLFWDLSKGNPSLIDIEELLRWANYMTNSKGIKKLCDIL